MDGRVTKGSGQSAPLQKSTARRSKRNELDYVTIVLIAAAMIVDSADTALLPAVFLEVQARARDRTSARQNEHTILCEPACSRRAAGHI